MKAKHIFLFLLISLVLCSCNIVVDGNPVGYSGNEYFDFSYTGASQTRNGETSIGTPAIAPEGKIFNVLSFAVTNRSYSYRYIDMFNSNILITLSNGSVFYGKYSVTGLHSGCTGTMHVYFEIPQGYSLNNARLTISFRNSYYPYESYASTCYMRLPSNADPRDPSVAQSVQGIYAYKNSLGNVDAIYGFLGENVVKVFSTGKVSGFFYGYSGNNLRMFYTSNNSEEPRKVSELIRLGDSTVMESLYNGSGSNYKPSELTGIWFTPDNTEGFVFTSTNVTKYSWNGAGYSTVTEPWYCQNCKLFIQESGVYKSRLFAVSTSSAKYLVYGDKVYTKRTVVPAGF